MNVFVYGTLCDPGRTCRLLGHATYGPDAELLGLQRSIGRYPTLVPGDRTSGRILRLEAGDMETLDAYEGVDHGLYVRIQLPSKNGEPVWTYIGNPVRIGVDASWPGDGPFDAAVRRYIERNDVWIELQ